MKPIDQTIFDPEKGNCFNACLASILEIDLETIPYLMRTEDNPDGLNWFQRYAQWLFENHGLGIVLVDVALKYTIELPLGTYVLLCGLSPRSNPENPHYHSVVGQWEVKDTQYYVRYVHDPHPSRDFIDGEPTDMIILVRPLV